MAYNNLEDSANQGAVAITEDVIIELLNRNDISSGDKFVRIVSNLYDIRNKDYTPFMLGLLDPDSPQFRYRNLGKKEKDILRDAIKQYVEAIGGQNEQS